MSMAGQKHADRHKPADGSIVVAERSSLMIQHRHQVFHARFHRPVKRIKVSVTPVLLGSELDFLHD